MIGVTSASDQVNLDVVNNTNLNNYDDFESCVLSSIDVGNYDSLSDSLDSICDESCLGCVNVDDSVVGFSCDDDSLEDGSVYSFYDLEDKISSTSVGGVLNLNGVIFIVIVMVIVV